MALELIYVHFPKAAGTSLAGALKTHYGNAMIADYDHPPPYDWSEDPPRVSDSARAVYGHFHADRYAHYRNAFRFTFLREPVDNLISIYFFWRTFPPSGYPAHERFLREKPTIFEFAEYPEIQRLASSCYFSGVDLDQFDFVGFFERRTEDVLKLSQRLGVALTADVQLNRTDQQFDREREELNADQRAIARLRNLVADDVAFYQQAYRRRT